MKARRRSLAPTVYDLLETFIEARAAYAEVHDSYEERVKKHAAERGVDRKLLRLDAGEVSKLLDFARLESLRNGPCHDLKEIAHALFRRKASTDKLDRYASEIFHELSILKEEQYKVSTFAPEYHRRNELDEYESILDEVHEEFPRKVHNIHDLFERSRRRLESILRRHANDRVLVRSLFLFGDELLERAKDFYPRGLNDLTWIVYPQGPLEFFSVVAQTFAASGFKNEAVQALERALASRDDIASDGRDPPPLADLRERAERAETLLARWRPMTPPQVLQDARGTDQTAAPPPPLATGLGEDAAPGSADEIVEDAPPWTSGDTVASKAPEA
jgi:hypothetical protein